MWSAILLSSKSCCRLWSGCQSWLLLLLGLILLVCYPRRLTFPLALLQWSLLLVAGVCLGVITRDWVHVVGHSPVFQILLQIVVRMSVMASAPAWINSAGMLSTPADFPIFSALTAASICSRRTGWCSSSGICGQSSTVGSPSVS